MPTPNLLSLVFLIPLLEPLKTTPLFLVTRVSVFPSLSEGRRGCRGKEGNHKRRGIIRVLLTVPLTVQSRCCVFFVLPLLVLVSSVSASASASVSCVGAAGRIGAALILVVALWWPPRVTVV